MWAHVLQMVLAGIKDVPLVGLREAVEALKTGSHAELYRIMLLEVGRALAAAQEKLPTIIATFKVKLTVDDVAAILLYALQTPFYPTLNRALFTTDMSGIEPFKPYIKLLLTALYKLPLEKTTVYRGIRDPPAYTPQDPKQPVAPLLWWSFSSCTRKIHVVEGFMRERGPRAKLIIEDVPCVNLEAFSSFNEFERLILPGTSVFVISVSPEHDSGRRNVQLGFVKCPSSLDFVHPQWSAMIKETQVKWHIDPSEVTALDMTEHDGPLKIGVGSFASVHKGLFKDKLAAVKRLHAHWATDLKVRKLFLQEITVNMEFTHPNICRVLGGWDTVKAAEGIFPTIVMEYFPLKLTDVLADPDRHGLTPAMKHSIIYQIAECLMLLHARHPPVYHCDLKPDNIMLTEDLTVKLIDFGLAKIERMSQLSDIGGSSFVGTRGTFGYTVRRLIFDVSFRQHTGS